MSQYDDAERYYAGEWEDDDPPPDYPPKRDKMRKIELKQAGQEANLLVRSCALAKTGKYPEVEFTGTDDAGQPAMIAVNQKSTDRQLARINLTYQSAVGNVLRFSRSASDDPAKPYWNIDLMGDGPHMGDFDPHAGEPHPADREPQGAPVATKAPTIDPLYSALTKDTLANILPLYVKAGIPPTMEGLAAICNTRYINAKRGY